MRVTRAAGLLLDDAVESSVGNVAGDAAQDVLEQMCEARADGGIVLRADAVPHLYRDGRGARVADRLDIEAVAQIHAHFAERLTLDEIAAHAGVHPVHLATVFRRRFDCTIGDYIRDRRIEYASRELTTSSTPLALIALDAGFASIRSEPGAPQWLERARELRGPRRGHEELERQRFEHQGSAGIHPPEFVCEAPRQPGHEAVLKAERVRQRDRFLRHPVHPSRRNLDGQHLHRFVVELVGVHFARGAEGERRRRAVDGPSRDCFGVAAGDDKAETWS